MSVFVDGEKPEDSEKTLGARTGIEHRSTVVGGERPHLCTIPTLALPSLIHLFINVMIFLERLSVSFRKTKTKVMKTAS